MNAGPRLKPWTRPPAPQFQFYVINGGLSRNCPEHGERKLIFSQLGAGAVALLFPLIDHPGDGWLHRYLAGKGVDATSRW